MSPGQVDFLATGCITAERAMEIAAVYPELKEPVVGWIIDSWHAENWCRVVKLANLAAPLRVRGLGPVLADLLDAKISALNNEDIVDILGEIRAIGAERSIFDLVERSVESDSPAFWLCQKAIMSLGEIDTDQANEYLHAMTGTSWPDALRWHAAVELQIEDALGFEEDHMLG